MKIAAMQPYFLPYIGYWQLLGAVDVFVILDDVNFITRGYINRNNILLNNRAHLFSLSLDRPSQNRLIKDTRFKFPQHEREKLLKTIQTAYRRAPNFESVYSLLEGIVMYSQTAVADFIENSLRQVSAFVGIGTRLVFSSQIDKNENATGQERILELCRALNGDVYINPPGGRSLYSPEAFRARGMTLRFIQPHPSEYRQLGAPFVPNLSFLDAMMFNGVDDLRQLLQEYSLDEPD